MELIAYLTLNRLQNSKLSKKNLNLPVSTKYVYGLWVITKTKILNKSFYGMHITIILGTKISIAT